MSLRNFEPKPREERTPRGPKIRLHAIAPVLLAVAGAVQVHACGPFFPNNLLGSGDAALLAAPVANFRRELERLELSPGRFEFVPATNGFAQQSLDAELSDLTAALKKAKIPDLEATQILIAHAKNRSKLQQFQEPGPAWDSQPGAEATTDPGPTPLGPIPPMPIFESVPGLPAEFAGYFAGASAWRGPQPDVERARAAWESVLELPAAERKFKSTWAAYMLGVSWEDAEPDRALKYFRLTQDFARQGFADSAGLALAAIGLEARLELKRDHLQRALQLYLQQYAAGDDAAVQSLRLVAARAVALGGPELLALATNTQTRAVVTAQLISQSTVVDAPADDDASAVDPVTVWLNAVEAAGVKDVAAAERLALAAYQNGEFNLAQRWINRARTSPVAQWLQAKLFLRAGKIDQAAGLLAKVTHQLPPLAASEVTNSVELVDALSAGSNEDEFEPHPAREQLLGEFGTLALSRGEFEQALDALLRANFWEDAAYVAERILTTGELKAYVDREWPASAANQPATVTPDAIAAAPAGPGKRAADLRYLLARRLTRESRGSEARSYFPAEWQPRLDDLIAALDGGWNDVTPRETRARSLFAAAIMTRTNGMELMGTELAPDWFIHGGNYDSGLTASDRQTNDEHRAQINFASPTELGRAAAHGADPEARFHYRYQAAFLAWEAAKLLPDNSDETARVLCTGGSWLKRRDAATADLFYKALVRRCRKTAIGAQADRMRWFPILDESGQPKPYEHKIDLALPLETDVEHDSQTTTEAPPSAPEQTHSYMVHAGDTLAAIAAAASELGGEVTVADLLAANPGLEANRLRIGQVIVIPARRSDSEAGPEVPR